MGLFKKKSAPIEENYPQYEDDYNYQGNNGFQSVEINESSLEENQFLYDQDLVSNEYSGNKFEQGSREWMDIIAPESIFRGDIEDGDWIMVGDKYVRPFFISGFPNSTYVTWLSTLYDSTQYDLDIVVHIQPLDTREALKEINSQISKVLTELIGEEERNAHINITRLQDQRSELLHNRKQLERNVESAFHVQITCNLYANSLKELNREYDQLISKLASGRVAIETPTLQQEEGYLSSLPVGKTFLPKKFRNFNSSALAGCFPFYNSDVIQEDGVLLGTNLQTRQPVMMNFYNDDYYTNPNITILGISGSGKSYSLSIIIIRSIFYGIRTAIVDPEAEFNGLTLTLGGELIRISGFSDQMLNPFDLSAGYDADLNKVIVDIDSKVSDLLSLIDVMIKSMWTQDVKSDCATVLSNMYASYQITEDPESLYEPNGNFNASLGQYSEAGVLKRMPTMSVYVEHLKMFAEREQKPEVQKVATALRMFTKDGTYGMFDTESSAGLETVERACLINFDVSKLESAELRPIGMYIALSWIWEKFGKKNVGIKKRIICDEAWMMVSPSFEGYEYTAGFLDVISRRIRKNTGGLVVASQKLLEFTSSNSGLAVITNSATKMFLKQDEQEIGEVKKTFKLSDREAEFLLKADKGQMLIKTQKFDSVICQITPFPYEQRMIEESKAEMARMRQT